jgi:hypothetical protein
MGDGLRKLMDRLRRRLHNNAQNYARPPIGESLIFAELRRIATPGIKKNLALTPYVVNPPAKSTNFLTKIKFSTLLAMRLITQTID